MVAKKVKLINFAANERHFYENFSLSRVLDDVLKCNQKPESNIESASIQYYFFFITCHNQMTEFSSKYIEIKPTYWLDLFSQNFENLKVLNLALTCNDDLLKLIPTYCPNLETLNASSRYVLQHPSITISGRGYFGIHLAVSDAGLRHLKDCKKLRVLVLNEPRGERPIANNHITYNGLRYLLRHIRTLEDISYSDIGHVITTNFEDSRRLNLKVIRHIHPTGSSLRRIFNLCKQIKVLNLRDPTGHTTDPIEEICRARDQKFSEIEFQNISFGNHFEVFFKNFGENLVSISISYTCSDDINFNQIVMIGAHCPNLEFFLCNNISNAVSDGSEGTKLIHFRPFAELRSLHISGMDLDLGKLLPYFTENATRLTVLKIHELCHVRIADKMILNFTHGPCLRHLEVSRLQFTRHGIEMLIEKFINLNFLIVTCTEDCRDLIASIKVQNYEIVMIIKPPNLL